MEPPFGGAQGQEKRQWAQIEAQEVPFEHQETLFHCEGDKHWHRLPREVVGSPSLRDIQKLSGHGPGKPVLGGPA